MKRMLVVVALAVSCSRAFAQTDAAQGDGAGGVRPFLAVRLGMFNPTHQSLEHMSPGFDAEVGVGVYFLRYFAAEAAFARYGATGKTSHAWLWGYSTPTDTRLDVEAWTATLKIIAPIREVALYALGGAGKYVAKWEFTRSPTALCAPWYDCSSYTMGDSDAAFGLHGGGGVSVRLTDHAQLGFEGRYVFVQGSIFGYPGGFDPNANVYVGAPTWHANGLRFAGAMSYRF